jgi:hypothetical protein
LSKITERQRLIRAYRDETGEAEIDMRKVFPSGVGRLFVKRGDKRHFAHRMQRGEGMCPQTRLWAQTSDGGTEHGRNL